MVNIEGLYKKFGNNEVLKGIDLEIDSPGIFAVVGPNGSGKTTLIKSILGMVHPDRGTVFVHGKDIKRGWKYRTEIDYLPQIANFPANLTVKELISMMKDLRKGRERSEELIDFFQLVPFLDKKLVNLSGGTKQKVNLVMIFMFDSPLVILDEPTSGLDPISLIRLKELLQKEKSRGKTLLITSHIINFVEEVAEKIIFLLEGEIYFNGTIADLKVKSGETNLEHSIASILSGNHA